MGTIHDLFEDKDKRHILFDAVIIWECKKCGFNSGIALVHSKGWNYCPNCGIKLMR